ncbi:MAG: hypothetical protein A2017_17490 [Lentisphaerae bacterium GWF2_44_16]|nr:MAG: hypothetical protein A2017_17490 [Lentisphaerae bacterium GWF2_44_16]HAU65893.1 hypothetical protein [Candidatus Uhrbacteria bacterium]
MTSESIREKLESLTKEELIDLFTNLIHQNDTVEAFLMNRLFGAKDNYVVVHKKIEKMMSNQFGEYQKAFKLFDTYIKSSSNSTHSLELSCDFMEWLMEEADTYSETFPDTLIKIITYVYEIGVVLAAQVKNDNQTRRLHTILGVNRFDEDIKETLSGIYYDYLNDPDDVSPAER